VGRLILFLVLAAALAGGGYYLFVANAPPPAAPAPPPAPPRVFASTCNTENARYAMRGRADVTFLFEVPTSSARTSAVPDIQFRFTESLPTIYAVNVGDRAFRFIAAETRDGEAHLFPLDGKGGVENLRGDDLIPVAFLDPAQTRQYGLPRRGFSAPEHISAPNLGRYIARVGGEPAIAIGAEPFDFVRCDADLKLQPGAPEASGYTPPQPVR
jgi:hypothetical protein